MRVTHNAAPRAPLAGRPRYRLDFFVQVQRSGARPRGSDEREWWLVEQVHVEDAEVGEVLEWAQKEAGTEGRFVVYHEQTVTGPDGPVTVTSVLAGADPRAG